MKQFSILIPSWNNLPFLKLCIESIRKHSACDHQIIVHVNEGTDGTLEWVQGEGLDYTYTPQNVGVCFSLPDNRFFLSATTIQPHTPGDSLLVADYGDQVGNFREQQLLADYMSIPMEDWMGATMPPNVVHRDLWDMVGGYSVELSPGMYSDPDFTAKLWLFGVRYMKGLSASRVYHFESKSTGKVRKNNGQMQFLMKWGMTSSTFRKLYTWRGRDFSPTLIDNPESGSRLRMNIIRGRLKALWYVVRGTFRPIL